MCLTKASSLRLQPEPTTALEVTASETWSYGCEEQMPRQWEEMLYMASTWGHKTSNIISFTAQAVRVARVNQSINQSTFLFVLNNSSNLTSKTLKINTKIFHIKTPISNSKRFQKGAIEQGCPGSSMKGWWFLLNKDRAQMINSSKNETNWLWPPKQPTLFFHPNANKECYYFLLKNALKTISTEQMSKQTDNLWCRAEGLCGALLLRWNVYTLFILRH